jgi:DNA-binding NarL/FixJ family response regulator
VIQELGYIKVSLNCEEMSMKESEPPSAMVILEVTDSGKGISRTYMDSKLFTSFAQENPLAPGTGLGLSLVRSLVLMMDGQIEIKSEVNHGTTVTVKIPMKRAGTQEPRDGFHRPNEDDIQILRTIQPRPQIYNFQQNVLPQDTAQKQEGYQMQKHALAACINGWYKVEDLHDWDLVSKPDIILVDDIHLLAITKHLKILEDFDAVVLILCSDRSRTTAISRTVQYHKLHIMSKPFGPFKLAKALKHALDKRAVSDHSVPCIEMDPIPELKQSSPALKRSTSYSQDLSRMLEARRASFQESFPFPSMEATQDSPTPTPSIQVTTPKLEVPGTYHRRLKTLDVPLLKQQTTTRHGDLVRSQSDSHVEHATRSHSKPRILLVDDNEVNLKLLQTFFVRRDFKDMSLARDGSEAVRVYEDSLRRSEPFHLVFMDISMPVRVLTTHCHALYIVC